MRVQIGSGPSGARAPEPGITRVFVAPPSRVRRLESPNGAVNRDFVRAAERERPEFVGKVVDFGHRGWI